MRAARGRSNLVSVGSERERQASRRIFSVIVPVYGHWHLVPVLLEKLRGQTFGRDGFEVILVDNASPEFDPPPGLPPNARILGCDEPGSYAARNHGARAAIGEWLVFTDADCMPSAHWLAELHEAAVLRGQGVLMAGPVEIVSDSGRPGIFEIYDLVKGIPQERYAGRGYAATANLAVPKPVFDRLNGFDGSRFSGGDADFCRRAAAAGFPLVYVAGASVDHASRTTWSEIATKARRVKGGQLSAGPMSSRWLWLLRTLVPPGRGIWNFLRARQHPLRYRLSACLVLLGIWLVELAEAAKLVAGARPERQ